MKELNAKQEDIMLEAGREFDAERREEHRRESEDGRFECWKNDNLKSLKDDFYEENIEEFDRFCKEVFKEENG